MRRPRFYPGTILLTSLALSIASPASADASCMEEREVLVTAYYSPLPDQERYYLGSYEADIAFNGQGIAGNDGTPVYPGMIAAPPEYPFGTRIEIPELGVAGTVHDRGGKIITENDIPHLDLWMGEGEEGLARALQWGARKVTAHIYVPVPEHIPKENFDLAKFPAPESALAHIPSNPVSLLGIEDLRFGTTSTEVAALQHALQMLGYFDHDITMHYGDVTRDALRAFQRDAGLGGDGMTADEGTRRSLVAHRLLAKELAEPLAGDDILLRGAAGKHVRTVQRLLKLLGAYDGEITGEYDQKLMSAVYRFQMGKEIVAAPGDTGAGMVGPQTRRALLTSWREHRIARRGGVVAVAEVAGL